MTRSMILKRRPIFHIAAVLWVLLGFVLTLDPARALEGDVTMHDPSTVVRCDGRYWVYATGRGISVHSSADGFTWRREAPVLTAIPAPVHAAVPLNTGADVWAPDVVFMNGQYYLYYAVSHWGSNVSAVGLLTSPTLTPTDPRCHWTDRGVVVQSREGERLNAIDPCVLHAPDGTLWLTYGSYIGIVQMVQLDPNTGLRLAPDSPVYPLSGASEASALIAHDGWFYLFVNRGSCCKGAASTYNIRMGRSRKVTGPYLDRYGVDMLRGGGSLFLASAGGQIGPGHFGLVVVDGLERFSCHFEADAAHGGRSALDIRPLLWPGDGWPAAGANVGSGTCQIVSKRVGGVIQTPPTAGTASAIAPASAPPAASAPRVRLGPYITTDNQKWTLTPSGGGLVTMTQAGGGLALEAAPSGGVTAAPPRDADVQKWAVEQTGDGSFRIVSRATGLALTAFVGAGGGGGLGLSPYTGDDTQKWLLPAP